MLVLAGVVLSRARDHADCIIMTIGVIMGMDMNMAMDMHTGLEQSGADAPA